MSGFIRPSHTALFIGFINVHFQFNFIGTRWEWLELIQINNEFAKSLISENLTNTAALIGLSFVVIGFLFEIIKGKTGRHFNELIRASGLYISLIISLISVTYIAFFNLIKLSLDENALRNIAISTSYLLLLVILTIGIQFAVVVRLLSASTMSRISHRAIMKTGLKIRINEKMVNKSKQIMVSLITQRGGQANTSFLLTEYKSIRFPHLQNQYCADVNVLLYRWSIGRLKPNTTNTHWEYIRVNKYLRSGQSLLYYPEPEQRQWATRILLFTSMYLKSSITMNDFFVEERRNIGNLLHRAAEMGDQPELQSQLETLESLYDIYFQTRDIDIE